MVLRLLWLTRLGLGQTYKPLLVNFRGGSNLMKNIVVPKRTAWLIIVLGACLSGLFTAAVTQIDLTKQVTNVLPAANGGTGVNGTATFPSSGTVMTTTTNVAASQLPNPSA